MQKQALIWTFLMMQNIYALGVGFRLLTTNPPDIKGNHCHCKNDEGLYLSNGFGKKAFYPY